MKGQRIKLQDIIDGYYNPSNGNNNGCWISCKYFATSIIYGIFIIVAVVLLSVDFGVYLLFFFHSVIPF